MSLPGLKMVTTLAVNGNKKGLRDKPLKMGIDEYRQRLESGGKTKEESEYDRQWDKDERAADRRIALKRKLKSLEMSRRRMQQLYISAKVDLGKAHARRKGLE